MTDTNYSAEQGKRFWARSIVVGLVHIVLGLIYVIDGSPNDMNVGFWLYGFLGVFVLWPYQLVLSAKLRKCDGDVSKFLGTVLSVVSLVLSYRLWI